jgi:ABC-type branched-subunit amino acid transport system substrate-binding protein
MDLMADYMANILSFKKGSWLVVNDDMGADAAKFFTKAFEYNGGEIVSGEVFEASEMDLRNKISKIRDGDPDFILIVGRGSAMINACRQVREQNPDIPIIGGNAIDNELVWSALGEQANDFYFPSPFVDTEAQLYEKVSTRFFNNYGHEMNWCNIYGFTTANYLVKAFRKTNGDKISLRDYLENLDETSLRGKLQMSDHRDVLVDLVVRSRVEGRSVIVYDGNRQSKKQLTN